MTFRRLLATLVALVLPCLPLQPLLAGAQESPAPAIGAQVETLANGLRVVVLEDHAAPVVQVNTWYRFGALDETPGKTGLAHALEHMMFRGTRDLSSAGLIDMGARLGAEINAQTENEATHFYFVVPADRYETVLRVEADRMRNLTLDPKDWDLERGAVLQEWAQDHSNPVSAFLFKIGKAVYPNSRLGETALGERGDIERATVADLRRYYDAWYRPNNATIVVTGDVHAADVFAAARRWFGSLPAGTLPARREYPVKPARGVVLTDTADYPFTLLDEAYAAPGDAPATERDQLANDVALGALFNPRGPYRKALVESGLVLGYVPMPVEDRRASIVHILLVVAPGHTVDEVRSAYDRTTAQILAKGLDPDFIEATKREMIASLTYARDSIVGLGNGIGAAYVFPGDTDPATYAAMFAGVRKADVDAEARTIYTKQSVVGILRPMTTEPAKFAPPTTLSSSVSDDFGARTPNGPLVQPAWMKDSFAQPLVLRSEVDPAVTTLPNGMKLLVQRVRTNPTVFIEGVVRTSSTFDPPGKDGLGDIVSQLFGWGSVKYDYDAQRKLADDRAASLRFGTRFAAHGRAGDLPVLLDALSDDLRHPLFPADKFALVKKQTTGLLAQRALQSGYRAERTFATALYPPGDPALREATPATVAQITLDDVRAYHARYVRPDLTTLVVVGDVDPAQVAREVGARFGDWSATGAAPNPHLPPIPLPRAQRRAISSPIQDVAVELGAPALARTSQDYDALLLANAVYGGGSFESRLFREVREKRGLVYVVGSTLRAGRDRGTFTITFRAVPSKVDAADALIRAELRRMQTEDVSADELARAKTRVVASQLNAEQATAAIARDLLQIGLDGLSPHYYATLGERYAGITASDVRRAAQTYFHPDNLIEVRTGP
jgi:zinc protease